ncbi:MAG: hypothetical protein ACR2QM_11955 [Longimicrobiales bacterium]
MENPTNKGLGPYQPVACHLHDRLEDLAVRRKVCALRYYDDLGTVTEAAGTITDIYSRDQAEYLDLDSGLTVRLDALVSFEEL